MARQLVERGAEITLYKRIIVTLYAAKVGPGPDIMNPVFRRVIFQANRFLARITLRMQVSDIITDRCQRFLIQHRG